MNCFGVSSCLSSQRRPQCQCYYDSIGAVAFGRFLEGMQSNLDRNSALLITGKRRERWQGEKRVLVKGELIIWPGWIVVGSRCKCYDQSYTYDGCLFSSAASSLSSALAGKLGNEVGYDMTTAAQRNFLTACNNSRAKQVITLGAGLKDLKRKIMGQMQTLLRTIFRQTVMDNC